MQGNDTSHITFITVSQVNINRSDIGRRINNGEVGQRFFQSMDSVISHDSVREEGGERERGGVTLNPPYLPLPS